MEQQNRASVEDVKKFFNVLISDKLPIIAPSKKAKVTSNMMVNILINTAVKEDAQPEKNLGMENQVLPTSNIDENAFSAAEVVTTFFKSIGLNLTNEEIQNRTGKLNAKKDIFKAKFANAVPIEKFDDEVVKYNDVIIKGFAKITDAAGVNVRLFGFDFMNEDMGKIQKDAQKYYELEEKKEQLTDKVADSNNPISKFVDKIQIKRIEAKQEKIEDNIYNNNLEVKSEDENTEINDEEKETNDLLEAIRINSESSKTITEIATNLSNEVGLLKNEKLELENKNAQLEARVAELEKENEVLKNKPNLNVSSEEKAMLFDKLLSKIDPTTLGSMVSNPSESVNSDGDVLKKTY